MTVDYRDTIFDLKGFQHLADDNGYPRCDPSMPYYAVIPGNASEYELCDQCYPLSAEPASEPNVEAVRVVTRLLNRIEDLRTENDDLAVKNNALAFDNERLRRALREIIDLYPDPGEVADIASAALDTEMRTNGFSLNSANVKPNRLNRKYMVILEI